MSASQTSGEAWETSVTDLITDFRAALLALRPIMKRQHIEYVQPFLYDSYDELEQVLFKVFVVDPIEHALSQRRLLLHKMRFRQDDWSEVSFLSIERDGNPAPGSLLAVFGLSNTDELLSSVDAVRVDDRGQSVGEVFEVPFEGAVFALQERTESGALKEHRALRSLW